MNTKETWQKGFKGISHHIVEKHLSFQESKLYNRFDIYAIIGLSLFFIYFFKYPDTVSRQSKIVFSFFKVEFITIVWILAKFVLSRLLRVYNFPTFLRILLTISSFFIIELFVTTFNSFLETIYLPANKFNPFDALSWGSLRWQFLISLMCTSLYEGISLFSKWTNIIKYSNKLEDDFMSSQLYALKNQVDQHFIYNSLNIITSLIDTNKKQLAITYTKNLAGFLNYLMSKNNDHCVLLKDELYTLDLFLNMHKIRFKDSLSIVVKIPQDFIEKFYLPPFSLLILAENVLKHNIINKQNPLMIMLYVYQGCIVVSNRIQLRKNVKSNKMGIENLEKRYAMISSESIKVINNGKFFRVSIPLIDHDSMRLGNFNIKRQQYDLI